MTKKCCDSIKNPSAKKKVESSFLSSSKASAKGGSGLQEDLEQVFCVVCFESDSAPLQKLMMPSRILDQT